jgi:HEAT repeat protein
MVPPVIMDFLKEMAVGFKTAKSYPPTHPTMAKIITNTMNQLNKLQVEFPDFSMYFLEQTIIFQDLRIDVAKNLAMASFMDALKKNEINSLTFTTGISIEDMRNLYEVVSAGKLKVREYGDASTMLMSKGTERIKINAVKFGVQGGQAVVEITAKPAPEMAAALKTEEDFLKEIKNLKGLIEQGVSHLIVKDNLVKASEILSQAPADAMADHGEAVAKIMEQLPSEQRLEILQDMELKPFILKLFSHLDDETLIRLITSRATGDDPAELSKIISSVGEAKLTGILPELKKIIPNIYEYLAQVGLLMSEKITSLISKDDLRASLKPTFAMLDSPNSRVREEGMKSLTQLANNFVLQKYYDIAEEVVSRIALALENEAVEESILRNLDAIENLYRVSRDNGQQKLTDMVLEPFNRILGRSGLSAQFKKNTLRFLGETGNPKVIPTLFSFLWETGIYPDVRAAIIKFGKNAVPEALQTLKEAEDFSFRMKLVDIIKNIGAEAIEILLANLEASEWFLRRNVLAILGDIGDRSVLPRLAKVAEDPEDRVRLELVRAYEKMEYLEGLLQALNDASMEVKAEALRGLRKSMPDEKLPGLMDLFKEKGDAVHLELLKIVGDKKYEPASDPIVDLLHALEIREDQTAQGLKDLGISILVKLNAPDLRDRLTELKLTKDKVLSGLAAAAEKRISG